MSFSYRPLWKTMDKRKIKNKSELMALCGISKSTLSKLSKNENVNMEILDKLCNCLECQIDDVLIHQPEEKELIEKNEEINKLRVASLFSGIGGFELGMDLSKLDYEIVFSSEIDRFARQSYEANYTDHNLVGDIKSIDENDVPDHDILIGGFPCQAFSIAGTRNGFEDIRGTLFFDIARILKEKKPKFVLLENVKNLVSHDKSTTINVILQTLQELGYTVDFTIINSKEAGLPQNRDRTYILGILNFETEKYVTDFRSKKINNLKSELNLFGYKSFNFFNDLKFTSSNQFIEDIIESEVNIKYYFNSNEVEQFLSTLEDKKITKNKHKIMKLFDIPKNVINDNERQRRVYSIKGLSPTVLARSDSTKILINHEGELKIRKFTPIENLRAQGFIEDFINNIVDTNVSDTQLYKQSGNAVSPPVVTGIINHLVNQIELGV